MNQIPDDLGTAVNVQAMVFGNMGDTSATGVGFTRNPATGEKVFYGEFLVNAQGEDVVAGIRTPQPISELEKWNADGLQPAPRDHHDAWKSTTATCRISSSPSRTASSTCCRPATASAPARRRCASPWTWWREGLITKEEAVLRVDPQQLDQLLHPVFDPASKKTLTKLAKGLPASPGRRGRHGRLHRRRRGRHGRQDGPVILVRKETAPDDIHGMEVAKGILTARGGMTSHAAVVCRGMGTPCVAGAEAVTVNEHKKEVTVTVERQAVTLKEGDWISLDGSTGEVFAGKANTLDADPTLRHPGQLHELGRRVPRQLRRARQCGYPARRQGGPQVRRRRHRPVPHRAHVLRRGPHRRTCRP